MKVAKLSLEDSIHSLIEPIVMATLQARWEGVDGVSYYLNSGRIEALGKFYGAAFKTRALTILFGKIANVSEQAIETLVLRKFTETYPDAVMSYVKENPDLFRNSVLIGKCCINSLPLRFRKKFLQLVELKSNVA